jgi:hypothetical protein
MKNRLQICMFFLLAAFVPAQDRPLVHFLPLAVEEHTEETQSIENLLRSYIEDLGELDAENPEYIFSGQISSREKLRVLTLDIRNEKSGEIQRYIYTFTTLSELALKSRSLVGSIFTFGAIPPEQFLPEQGESISLGKVVGTWRNVGLGIKMMRLERDGTGMALFSSGANMHLEFHIEENTLKIRQTSPNVERFYHPLPLETARHLAENAEPMRWELLLVGQGTTLRGILYYTEAQVDGDTIKFNMGTPKEAELVRR